MDYALSTVGQGAICFIGIPTWTFNANTNTTGISFIEVDLEFHSYRGASFGYVLGASGSTQNALRVDAATGQLQFRQSATPRISSDVGAIVLNRRYKFRLEYNKSTTTTTLFLDGVQISTPWVGANSVLFNQVGRFFTTAATYSDLTVYGFKAGGLFGSYTDEWNATTAGDPAIGTTWNSVAGTRVLTISGATGAANSWWAGYGVSVVGQSTFTVSAVASVEMTGLKTSISSAGATGYFSVTTEGAKCAYASPSLNASSSILLTSTKIASSLVSAAAAVFFGLNYRKQGAQKVAIPGSGTVVLAANKGGVSTLSIPVAVEVGLYSGPVSNVSGTFTVSASAAFSFKSSKVAASSTQFAAAAAFAIASNKSGRSNAVVTAAATVSATAAKSSHATLSIAITTNITINGQNLSAGEPEQWPVDVVFVSTNSRYQHVIASGSRFEYHITTHTRGGRSV